MQVVQIPDQELPVLRRIAEYEVGFFDSLLSALASTEATLTAKQLAARVSKRLNGISPSEIFPILNTLCALFYMKDRENVSAETIANAVSESAIKESAAGNDALSPAQAQLLQSRLKLLLALDQPLGITAKALDIMTENQNVFCGARILSDIRPIFTNQTDKASAAVIVHNLQIGFHNSGTGQHQEFYVSLDTEDIETLKRAIVRAEEKTKALKLILEASKLNYLQV